jgi:hypothetical protein
MAEISDVKVWVEPDRKNGRFCIAYREQSGYVSTLCGLWGNMGTTKEKPPEKKICKNCLKQLRNATVTTQENKSNATT